MKLKKGRLLTLIIAIVVTLGNVVLAIYRLINNDLEIVGLILDVLMLIVMVSVIFDCFEKKNK